MKVNVGKHRTIIIALAGLIILGAGLLYWFVIRDTKSSEPSQVEETPRNEVSAEELSNPSDYYAPSIDEIKNQHPEPADQYSQFMLYANLKQAVEKHDDAIELYKAAIEVAPSEDDKHQAYYALFLLGGRTDRQDIRDEFQQKLSSEWLAQQQAAVDEQRDRQLQ